MLGCASNRRGSSWTRDELALLHVFEERALHRPRNVKLRFLVNGKRLTETQPLVSGRLVGVELFVYSETGGTDIRFDNVFGWPVP